MNRVFINGFVFGLIMLSSCGDKSTVEEFETGLYGNTFINIEHSSFDIPDNWETDTFFNGAFKMDIPEYMEIADEDECIVCLIIFYFSVIIFLNVPNII